jgi:hypothetical protein
MSEDAIISFAGEKTMNTLNLRPVNRPTIPGMQGEVANQILTFKAFLGNVLSKVVQNVRLAKGTFIEVPNKAWHPGADPSIPKYIPLEQKDAGNLLKFLAVASAMGGTMGIPLIGWTIGEWNTWTGRDETLNWKKEAEKHLPVGLGRFVGAMLDKGVVGEYIGYDMSELGNLMLPTTKDGLVATIMPAAISIAGQAMRDAYSAATETKPMQRDDVRFLRAVSPNAFKHFLDTAQLLANRGRIYNAEGQLIGKATPADAVKLAFAGMAPLREEDYRMVQVDKNIAAKRANQMKYLAETIARKITNNETLDTHELSALWGQIGVQRRVRANLRKATIPTYAKLWKSIQNDPDPESAQARAEQYQRYWQNAVDNEGDAEE